MKSNKLNSDCNLFPGSMDSDSFVMLELKIKVEKLYKLYLKSNYYIHFKQISRISNVKDVNSLVKGFWYNYIILGIDPKSFKVLSKQKLSSDKFIKSRLEFLRDNQPKVILYHFHEWLKNRIMLINTNEAKFGSIILLSQHGLKLLNELTNIQSSSEYSSMAISYNLAKLESIRIKDENISLHLKANLKRSPNQKWVKYYKEFGELKTFEVNVAIAFTKLKQNHPNDLKLQNYNKPESFNRAYNHWISNQ